MASFLQKLTPIYSLGRWILCNGSLIFYREPSNEELLKLSGKQLEKQKGKRKNNNQQKQQTFKIPKNLEVSLSTDQIKPINSLVLRSYSEYEWIVNYALFVVLVYATTEVYYELWKPSKELNMSLIWIALSVSFALKNMFNIIKLYIKSGGGEMYLSVVFGIFSFILSLGLLTVSEDYLDFGMSKWIEVDARQKVSGLKILLAFASALHGVIFAFPAFRMAQMYRDAVKYSEGSRFLNTLLHFNFVAPLLVAAMWVKPVVRDFVLKPGKITNSSVTEEVLSMERFEVYRIAFVVAACLLKFILIRPHLQAYLNIAYDRTLKLRKEAGKITNVEYRTLVAQVYYYLGVVAIQYLCPLVVHLSLAFCLKTLGNYTWTALYDSQAPNFLFDDVTPVVDDVSRTVTSMESSLKQMISDYNGDLKRATSLPPNVWRSVIGYFVFYSNFNWFGATCVGLLHHAYF